MQPARPRCIVDMLPGDTDCIAGCVNSLFDLRCERIMEQFLLDIASLGLFRARFAVDHRVSANLDFVKQD
jgi:hypothetical protein